jgi:hypothetical protein
MRDEAIASLRSYARQRGKIFALDRKLGLRLLHRRDGRAVHAGRRRRLLELHAGNSVCEDREVGRHVKLCAARDLRAAKLAEASGSHPAHRLPLVEDREQFCILPVVRGRMRA